MARQSRTVQLTVGIPTDKERKENRIMAQYIDKDALVAEIENLENKYKKCPTRNSYEEGLKDGRLIGYKDALWKINSLEVKDMDLDEVKIGETKIYLDDDGGEPPYDGKQWLDLTCTEYEIPKDKFNDGDNVEIFIRKTQKGE